MLCTGVFVFLVAIFFSILYIPIRISQDNGPSTCINHQMLTSSVFLCCIHLRTSLAVAAPGRAKTHILIMLSSGSDCVCNKSGKRFRASAFSEGQSGCHKADKSQANVDKGNNAHTLCASGFALDGVLWLPAPSLNIAIELILVTFPSTDEEPVNMLVAVPIGAVEGLYLRQQSPLFRRRGSQSFLGAFVFQDPLCSSTFNQ